MWENQFSTKGLFGRENGETILEIKEVRVWLRSRSCEGKGSRVFRKKIYKIRGSFSIGGLAFLGAIRDPYGIERK